MQEEDRELVVDTYLDDYDDFLEEEERWRPAGPNVRHPDRNACFRRRNVLNGL